MYCTIDGGDDADALLQQVVHILPALRIAAARRIVEGQLVDQADLRDGGGRRRGVDDLVDAAIVLFTESGDHFQLRDERLRTGQ